MKKTINRYEFVDAFTRMGRKDNFSYEALNALFDYLEELEDDRGIEFELDVIGLCCDWNEYDNIESFNHDYNKEYSSFDEIDDTIVIPVDDNKFIVFAF